MSKHIFNLRMRATYKPSENEIDMLDVEVLADDGWTALDFNLKTPGFLIYVYAMFTCQHLYMRTNGTESGLSFASSTGQILVEASEDWLLEKADISFKVQLSSGEASEDKVGYIVSRMKQCPVSKNLPAGIDVNTRVEFDNE